MEGKTVEEKSESTGIDEEYLKKIRKSAKEVMEPED